MIAVTMSPRSISSLGITRRVLALPPFGVRPNDGTRKRRAASTIADAAIVHPRPDVGRYSWSLRAVRRTPRASACW
jgi:hypothetical protein